MNKGGSYVYTQSFGPDRRITPTRGRPARERERRTIERGLASYYYELSTHFPRPYEWLCGIKQKAKSKKRAKYIKSHQLVELISSEDNPRHLHPFQFRSIALYTHTHTLI